MMTPSQRRLFNTHRHVRQVVYNPRNRTHQLWLRQGTPIEEDVGTLEQFSRWVEATLGPEPFVGARLIRKDHRRGWIRSNIEWNTHQAQGDRLLSCAWITYQGETRGIHEWCRKLGLSKWTVYQRRARGITDPQLLFSQQPLKGVTAP